jgi:hypothetical protein
MNMAKKAKTKGPSRNHRPEGCATESTQPDLIDPPAGTRPIEGQWATAAQLHPFTGMDEAQLRRLGRETNPATGQAWLPAPVRSRWPVAQTLIGANAWWRWQMEKRGGLPEGYANIGDFCAQTKFPRVMMEYALKHGCQCRDTANRIYLTPFLEFFQELFTKIFSGGGAQIKNLEGFEELDSDLQLARLRKEQADALVDEKNIREGRLVDINVVEELLWEKRDAPLRAALLNFSKLYAQQCNPANPLLAQKVLDAGVAALLKQIRDRAPKQKLELANKT